MKDGEQGSLSDEPRGELPVMPVTVNRENRLFELFSDRVHFLTHFQAFGLYGRPDSVLSGAVALKAIRLSEHPLRESAQKGQISLKAFFLEHPACSGKSESKELVVFVSGEDSRGEGIALAWFPLPERDPGRRYLTD